MNQVHTPLAYLHTAGPAADPVTRLGWVLGAVSLAVVLIIATLLLMAIFRRRGGPASSGVPGGQLMPVRERSGLRWIYVGTGISTGVLFACAVFTLYTLAAVAKPSAAPRVVVEVQAAQFWWRIRYVDAAGNVLLTTANEIHIPVGEPVQFRLSSSDVIHSFWVPSLGGKMDVLPGQTNVTWLQGDKVGRYRGQCGEYCGAQHAHMALFINVDTRASFEDWVAAQRTGASSSSAVTPGMTVFVDKCGGCHAVQGSAARGAVAPDLTHLMSRQTIAAGALDNDPANLKLWISKTQSIKPGSEMPTVTLTPAERDAVVDYLQTLR